MVQFLRRWPATFTKGNAVAPKWAGSAFRVLSMPRCVFAVTIALGCIARGSGAMRADATPFCCNMSPTSSVQDDGDCVHSADAAESWMSLVEQSPFCLPRVVGAVRGSDDWASHACSHAPGQAPLLRLDSGDSVDRLLSPWIELILSLASVQLHASTVHALRLTSLALWVETPAVGIVVYVDGGACSGDLQASWALVVLIKHQCGHFVFQGYAAGLVDVDPASAYFVDVEDATGGAAELTAEAWAHAFLLQLPLVYAECPAEIRFDSVVAASLAQAKFEPSRHLQLAASVAVLRRLAVWNAPDLLHPRQGARRGAVERARRLLVLGGGAESLLPLSRGTAFRSLVGPQR